MVDRGVRNRLAELVRHLVTGQISTDEFSDEAGELAENSSDCGVWAVYGFAEGLYGDVSALWTIRLRGRFRLAPDIRCRMAVAALFLYSDVEYEWPASARPRGACLDCLLVYICGAFVFAGLMLLPITIIFWWCAFASVGCFVAAVLIYRLSQRLAVLAQTRWEEQQMRFGEYRVWPFLRLADFEEARQHPRLLGGSVDSRQGGRIVGE